MTPIKVKLIENQKEYFWVDTIFIPIEGVLAILVDAENGKTFEVNTNKIVVIDNKITK